MNEYKFCLISQDIYKISWFTMSKLHSRSESNV
nr:MAG TPA: hypothetical protein [Caudoviricetes sp.]